jgi:MFS family permease
MISALREKNYRLFVSGQLISLTGGWMQRVAQDWLVLELSHNNAIALGIATALQFLPTIFLSLWAGVLADRTDKRKVLIGLEAAMGMFALVLGVLAVTGVVQLWHVFAFCLALGAVSAVETPMRQSFVVEMVGKDQLTNAVALNSVMFNSARLIGPAIAGILITLVGSGWVFMINAASYVAVVVGLLAMDAAKLHRSAPLPRHKGQLMEGLRYVRQRSDLVTLMVVAFFVSTFGQNFAMTLATIARNVFHSQADLYGLLSAILAVGTLIGAASAAKRSSANGKPSKRLLMLSAAGFGVAELVTGFMPNEWLLAIMLIPTGAFLITFNTAANATVQLSVRPEMRGRVMGLYVLVLMGGAPIGGPVMGWLAQEFGGRMPLVFGGIVAILAASYGAIALRNDSGLASLMPHWSKRGSRLKVWHRTAA